MFKEMEINFSIMKNSVTYILWIICIIFIWAIYGCGARKTEVIKTETIDNTKTETNIKRSEVVTVNDKHQTTTTEEVIEPIDATKEAVYIDKIGNKQILHNAKKRSVTAVKNNNTKTESNKVADVYKVEQKAIIQTSKVKHIDKKQFNPFQLLWLLIPIGVIYWAYRKYKNLTFYD
jgi:hypothetical protein